MLALLPRKPDWEAYGKQVRLFERFLRKPISPPMVHVEPTRLHKHPEPAEERTFTRLRLKAVRDPEWTLSQALERLEPASGASPFLEGGETDPTTSSQVLLFQ